MSCRDTPPNRPKESLFQAVWSFPHAWYVRRIIFTYVGVVLPIICFALTWNAPIESPVWQSGNLSDYADYLLWGKTAVYFFPLIAYSMACFALATFQVKRTTDNALVRAGVFGGVLLTAHFAFVVAASLTSSGNWLGVLKSFVFLLLLAPLAGVLCLGVLYAVIAFPLLFFRDYRLWLVVGILVFLVAVTSIFEPTNEAPAALFAIVLAPLGISIVFAPYLTLFAYAYLSYELCREHRRYQFRLWHLLFAFSWLAAYMAAFRAAIQVALEEYSKLPTDPPADCYIATAAARGHRQVVGSWRVRTGGGRTTTVNQQLQTFKAGELAIRAAWPRGHRWMRLVYDRIGPRLARRIRHPLLADAAYVTLKPLEWATAAALRLLGIRYRQ